jgi:hypothetical protein
MTRRGVHSLKLLKQVCDAFKESTHYMTRACILVSLKRHSGCETTITAHIYEMHTLCGFSPYMARDGWMVCILKRLSDGIYILYGVDYLSVKNYVFYFLMLSISFTITI